MLRALLIRQGSGRGSALSTVKVGFAEREMAGIVIACHPSYGIRMDNEDRSSTSMNVSLPKKLRSYIDERVSSSAYTSASEYVRELVRRDREQRSSRDRLEELLLEGIASGPAAEWTDEDWASLRDRVAKRLEDKQSFG